MEGDRDGETPREAPVEVTDVGGTCLLQEVYVDFPQHNNRSHLDRETMDDAVWQNCLLWLTAQSASWYAMPS